MFIVNWRFSVSYPSAAFLPNCWYEPVGKLTIGNAHEFAVWLEEIRGVRCGVITGPMKRPVPLRSAVLLPDKRLLPLMNEAGRLNPEIQALAADKHG